MYDEIKKYIEKRGKGVTGGGGAAEANTTESSRYVDDACSARYFNSRCFSQRETLQNLGDEEPAFFTPLLTSTRDRYFTYR